MSKTIAKQSKREQVDTEDRIMESVASVTMWARRNRRAATTVLIALVAVIAAGVIYVRYKADLQGRAAVRLDQIRLSSQGVAPQQLRQDLGVFITQFGGTPEAGEARLLLAEFEMRRDSVDAAIRALEPVAYQRRSARAAQARLHEFSGEYAEAARIYQELITDEDSGTDGAFYAVRLGEVLARAEAELPAPVVPVIEPRASTTSETDDASADEETASEE